MYIEILLLYMKYFETLKIYLGGTYESLLVKRNTYGTQFIKEIVK